MIKQEQIIINGRQLIKTYSDTGKYIIQVGTNVKYAEAVDIPNKHSYIESSEDIVIEENKEA